MRITTGYLPIPQTLVKEELEEHNASSMNSTNINISTTIIDSWLFMDCLYAGFGLESILEVQDFTDPNLAEKLENLTTKSPLIKQHIKIMSPAVAFAIVRRWDKMNIANLQHNIPQRVQIAKELLEKEIFFLSKDEFCAHFQKLFINQNEVACCKFKRKACADNPFKKSVCDGLSKFIRELNDNSPEGFTDIDTIGLQEQHNAVKNCEKKQIVLSENMEKMIEVARKNVAAFRLQVEEVVSKAGAHMNRGDLLKVLPHLLMHYGFEIDNRNVKLPFKNEQKYGQFFGYMLDNVDAIALEDEIRTDLASDMHVWPPYLVPRGADQVRCPLVYPADTKHAFYQGILQAYDFAKSQYEGFLGMYARDTGEKERATGGKCSDAPSDISPYEIILCFADGSSRAINGTITPRADGQNHLTSHRKSASQVQGIVEDFIRKDIALQLAKNSED